MKQDSPEPTGLDRIFAGLAASASIGAPIIACLHTGDLPAACAPMPRDPTPPVGQALDERFAVALAEMLRLNPAIHDGAIMIGRRTPGAAYKVTGWSYRLFPPGDVASTIVNRGSAFHSSLAMSRVLGIDRVYLASRGSLFRFTSGRWLAVE